MTMNPSAGEPVAPAPRPLILTARMSEDAQQWFESRRRAYFPPDRNQVPAHLTLFHQLPGDQVDDIEDWLAEETWRLDPMPANATHLRFTGQGVQVAVDAPSLSRLRERLAERWRLYLTPQDSRPHRAHVTLQNKAQAEKARRTFDALCATFEPFAFEIEGLQLWRYLGGPWEELGDFTFGGPPS